MTALAEARADFKIAVTSLDRRCLIHDDPADCDGNLQAHHVVYQKYLRAEGLKDELWNPVAAMSACERAHRRHHNGHEPIPRSRIPSRCLAFIERHDLGRYLDRYYPE